MLNKKGFNTRARIFDGINFSFLLSMILIHFLSPTEEQMLNLNLNFVLVLLFFSIGILVTWLLSSFGIHTWGDHIFRPLHEKKSEAVSWYKTLWGWQAFLVLAVTFIVGLVTTRFSFFELANEDGFAGAKRLFAGIFSPDWEILPKAVLHIFETIFMAFIATALSLPFAFVLSFLAAKNVMQGPIAILVYLILRTALNFVRSIEALVWAIIFSVWVGIGPFAGMLALMVHSIASLTKQYSEMVESVQEGPLEGILSTGAGRFQLVWYGIVPQIILPYISFTVYRWDINIRMATIIGLVGGGGIGTLLMQYQGQAMWPQVGCIIFVIAGAVWCLDQASAHIREVLK